MPRRVPAALPALPLLAVLLSGCFQPTGPIVGDWRGSQPANTPVPRKNRKRAHSSSPVGPSQDESRLSARKAGLTTPQADPASELWTRYTSKKTPTDSIAVTTTWAVTANV